MSTYKVASDKKHTPLALANILLITWLCSLLWGGGIVFAIIMTLAYIWQASYVINLILGLTTVFFSPVLLGASITHDWQRSIKAGSGSFLACILSFWIVWIGASNLYKWLQDRPNPLDSGALDDFFSLLLISLVACSAIITFILLIKVYQYQYSRLIVSAIIGIGLSIISGMILEKILLKNNEVLHLIWQIPSLVWISVIYFAELLAGRSIWKDFFVWSILVLISFGLLVVVVPLFPVVR